MCHQCDSEAPKSTIEKIGEAGQRISSGLAVLLATLHAGDSEDKKVARYFVERMLRDAKEILNKG